MRDFPNLDRVNVISYDTETTGVDPHKDRPVGYVFTWGFRPDESAYFPIRHEPGGNYEVAPVLKFAKATLARTDLRVVMHNAAFDLWMSEKDGIEINGAIEDTGLNDPLIDENQRKYSLAMCCERADKDVLRRRHACNQRLTILKSAVAAGIPDEELDKFIQTHGMSPEQQIEIVQDNLSKLHRVDAKKGEPMYEYLAGIFGGKANRDQMANFWRVRGDDPMANEYAAGDGTSTLGLWRWQQGKLDEQDLRRVWKVECDLVPVLHRARVRGVNVCTEELGRVEKEVVKLHKQASVDLGNLNPRASTEVGKYLEDAATNFGEHEWDETIVPRPPMTKPTKRFPKGQPSYTARYLEKFEAGQKLTRTRKLLHLKGSFIDPLRDRHVHNGKVYPNFWQLASDDYGTVTGRLSSSDPNMQQVPKRNKELGRIFRRVFTAPEGHDIWEMDYSQCEYRLFAHFSKSKNLIDGYNIHGIDMHVMVAKLLGIDRDRAKNMNFGMLYGMGGPSLAAQLGVGLDEAMYLRSEYLRMIPEAEVFMTEAGNRCRSRGYIKTLLGRRRRFNNPRKEGYKAINAICQGGNADILKMKMVEVDDYLRSSGRGTFALSVHDALVCYLDNSKKPKDTANEIMRICGHFSKEEHGFDLRVGMSLDAGNGPNWSIASYGEAMAA